MVNKIIEILFIGVPAKGEKAGPNPKTKTFMSKETLTFNDWARTLNVSSAYIRYS